MIEPMGNRVLVELEDFDLESDGIMLIDTHVEEYQTGVVVAVGEGSLMDGWVDVPKVSIGDKIIVSQTSGTMVRDGDKKYQIVEPKNIIGEVA